MTFTLDRIREKNRIRERLRKLAAKVDQHVAIEAYRYGVTNAAKFLDLHYTTVRAVVRDAMSKQSKKNT